MRANRIVSLVSLLGVVALGFGGAATARADRLAAADGGSVGNRYLGGSWSAKAWIENGAATNGFGGTADAKLKLLTREFNGFQGEAKVLAATSTKAGEIVLFAKVATKTLVSERNASYLSISKSLPPLKLGGDLSVGVGPVRLTLAGGFQAEAYASIRATAKLLVADGGATLRAEAAARVTLAAQIPAVRIALTGAGNGTATLSADARAEPTRKRGRADYHLQGGRFRLAIDAIVAGVTYSKTFVDEDLGYKHGVLFSL